MSQLGRRGFLKGSLFAGAALSTTEARAATGLFGVNHGLPTVQLFTDETSAQFRVLVNPASNIQYSIVASDGHAPKLESVTRSWNPYQPSESIEHLLVTGLSLNTVYTLNMISQGRIVDSREFTALDTRKANGRFALVSCMMDLLIPIQRYMWASMERARPDLIFFVGDSSYTDVGGNGTLESNWRRHMESRRSLDLYYWKRLIPIVATWDDHDYAGDNATKNNPLNGKSINVFKTMFGFTPRGSASLGPGVSSSMEFFGQRFYLMDCRTYRDEWTTKNGLHWGDEQENWLMSSLSHGATPTWLLNGSQFFGKYLQKDSFEGRHPYQFTRVLEKLRSIEAPVAFGSGDVHFSEVMRIEKPVLGYETYELVSSSMHSMTAPWINIRKVNPRRIATTWHYNYVVVQGRATPGRLDFRALSLGKNLNVYFDQKGSITRRSLP